MKKALVKFLRHPSSNAIAILAILMGLCAIAEAICTLTGAPA